jgi:hypothetical protein
MVDQEEEEEEEGLGTGDTVEVTAAAAAEGISISNRSDGRSGRLQCHREPTSTSTICFR